MGKLWEMMSGKEQVTALLNAYRQSFTGVQGKLVFADLIKKSGYGTSSYTEKCDPLAMAFKEGRKSIIEEIINRLKLNPDQVTEITETFNEYEG